MKKFLTLIVGALFVFGTAHAQFFGGIQGNGTSTGYTQAQAPASVVRGRVISVRDVTITQPTQGFSTQQMVGSGIGGAIGGAIGRKSNDFAVASVTTMIGMAVGGAVASNSSTQPAQEIIFEIEGTKQVSAVTQSLADGVRFFQGQPIVIIGGGRIAPVGY